jgi:hypothetical protein
MNTSLPALSSRDPSSRWTTLAILLLFLSGACHWYFFLNGGLLDYSNYDWGEEERYFCVIRQALTEGVIPFHMTEWSQYSDRFFANPEINNSPQIMLLPFMSTNHYILLDALIMYSIGFAGCLLIRRRFSLSLLPFTTLFLLFHFNGFILSHIAVGHLNWHGYNWLPLFVLAVFNLTRDHKRALNWIKLVVVLFLIVLVGFFHLYNWCILFLLALAICHPRYMRPVLCAIVVSALLASYRFWPAFITLHNLNFRLHPGYPNALDMLNALIMQHSDVYFRDLNDMFTGGWWEYNMYITIPGFLLVAYFGVYRRVVCDSNTETRFRELNAPCFIVALLTLNVFYSMVQALPLPLVNAERVPSRFLIVPLVFLIVLTVIQMEIWLRSKRSNALARTGLWLLLLALACLLFSHARIWYIVNLKNAFTMPYPAHDVAIVQKSGDTDYIVAFVLGLVTTLLTALALAVAWWKYRKKENTASESCINITATQADN